MDATAAKDAMYSLTHARQTPPNAS
jgi:hypothetical protein